MSKERYIIRKRDIESQMVGEHDFMMDWAIEKFGDDLELFDTILEEVVSVSSSRERLEAILRGLE